MGGIGAWLAAIVIPIAALVAPLVLVWQTGRLALVVDQAARRLSVRQARSRASRTRAGATTAAHRGRNLVRGARGQPAQQTNGQAVFSSGPSRSHAAGQRVRRALTRVRRGGASGRAGSGRQGGRGTDSSADDRYEPREFSDDRSARSGGERE
jgi:hypothetical protein